MLFSSPFEDLSSVVLDECDRLLDLGFREQIQEVLRHCPPPGRRQTLLFSATMNAEVGELASLSLKRPVRIAADGQSKGMGGNGRGRGVGGVGGVGGGRGQGGDVHGAPTLPASLAQEVVLLKGELAGTTPAALQRREGLLLALCVRSLAAHAMGKGGEGGEGGEGGGGAKGKTGGVLIFSRTKKQAHRLKLVLELGGLAVDELHGDMSQSQRLSALDRFTRQECEFLVATDVASRGLDVPRVRAVVSFDAPDDVTTYVHRVGRTARAGHAGLALTFLRQGDASHRALLKKMAKLSPKPSPRPQNPTNPKEDKGNKEGKGSKGGKGGKGKEGKEGKEGEEGKEGAGEKGVGSVGRVGRGGSVKSRVVPDAVVSMFASKVASMASDLQRIAHAEREAAFLRKAEAEAQRAENLVEHGDDIKAVRRVIRPSTTHPPIPPSPHTHNAPSLSLSPVPTYIYPYPHPYRYGYIGPSLHGSTSHYTSQRSLLLMALYIARPSHYTYIDIYGVLLWPLNR